ncbi:MAG: hypothetical protein J6W64_06895 [Bacilli bacterium]|nr:hypothetical protein [Bacilli bacterium]
MDDVLKNVQELVDENTFKPAQILSTEEFEDAKTFILQGLNELAENLSNLKNGDDITELLGGERWIEELNKIAKATGMTVDEMNSYLNSIGV